MKFGFTRDSALWWLTGAIGLITYLQGAGDPRTWVYDDWLQFAGATIVALSTLVKTSFLPHSEEGDAKITPSGR